MADIVFLLSSLTFWIIILIYLSRINKKLHSLEKELAEEKNEKLDD